MQELAITISPHPCLAQQGSQCTVTALAAAMRLMKSKSSSLFLSPDVCSNAQDKISQPLAGPVQFLTPQQNTRQSRSCFQSIPYIQLSHHPVQNNFYFSVGPKNYITFSTLFLHLLKCIEQTLSITEWKKC